ncbi:SgcJ/EcaC family oxidoreductase [Dyella acidiphila]|uniref:SgcJ/EcaC family oxidoreductase n=1 Tax=Dyella acidiphila TaxID=2775866 RepID=A0ABR9GCU5_9GAMM|nr:SgcJ/EcaC family oxidoreductase [Dyella acidiphila]MBE1161856.1 SgcJ/EcaC family oxidoreductase [Dyella acidiphila]
MNKFVLCMALLVSSASFAANIDVPKVYTEVAAKPADPKQAEIAALFDRWNATLATGDADQVTALYAPDAVLEPTVSNQVRTTPAEIRDYFVKFLKMKPQAVINYREIRLLSDDAALDTGVYTFALISKDGKAQTVHARYTYVYRKIGADWKIVNHHSSVMPEGTR